MVYVQNMNYFKVIHDIRNASQQEADADLDRLCESLMYTAPEARDEVFWYGRASTMGITEICRKYFNNNNEVYDIFTKALEDHKGVVEATRSDNRVRWIS